MPKRDDDVLASTLQTLANQLSGMQAAMVRNEASAPVVRQTRRASLANVAQDLESLKADASDDKVEAAKRDLADYRAAKGCENPNFKDSYLGRFPLVLADFWTSGHLSNRSRSMNVVS